MVRWFRSDSMDARAMSDPEERIERIRELVDELEGDRHLVISMLFFGAGPPTFADVAMELGVSVHKVKEILRAALAELKEHVLEDDGLGEVLSAHGSPFAALCRPSQVGDDDRDPGPLLPREDREGSDVADMGLDVGVRGEDLDQR